MAKVIGVAEVKKHFSEVMSEISNNKEFFIIKKKNKPMAAMVSMDDFMIIDACKKKTKGNGLLAAIGAWEDFKELEAFIEETYELRKKAKDRKTKALFDVSF